MKIKLLKTRKKTVKIHENNKKKRSYKKRVSYKKKGGNKLSGMVIQTEGESIFESYLTILTDLIGVQDIYKMIAYPIKVLTVHEKYCNTPWMKPDIPTNNEKFIYYCCKEEEYNDNKTECEPMYTHYKVLDYETRGRKGGLKPTIKDPYHLYQKSGSHGFCQMYAKFIADNDVNDFATIKNNRSYQKNTFVCLQKTLKIIQENETIYNVLQNGFNNDLQVRHIRENKGITQHMTFEQFIQDLYIFKLEDIEQYILELK
tara:strand:+ start:12595 stop:13368 length:774 start_codon:yes stop_codon:yes gene_type:complete